MDGALPRARSRGKSDEEERGVSFEELPYFLTPKQLVDVTGEYEESITRGIREGRIPIDKVNGRWRICRDLVFPNAQPERDGSTRVDEATRPPLANRDCRESKARRGVYGARGAHPWSSARPTSPPCARPGESRRNPHPTTTRERAEKCNSPPAVAECAPPRASGPACTRTRCIGPCPKRRPRMSSAERDSAAG